MPETTIAPENYPATETVTASGDTVVPEPDDQMVPIEPVPDPEESKNRRVLASAPIWRALIHLCIPMIAAFSIGSIYSIINAGFIGSLHSTPLLAALTFSLPVFSLIMAMGGVFGVGGGTGC